MQTYLNIPEGVGATLSYCDDQYFVTGTRRCLSCVGVYFKIDKSRCFMAHINAYSALTFPYNPIKSLGSRDIEDQVVKRLCGFVQKCKWDIHGEDFGKDIVLVCLNYEDVVVDPNRTYERIGKAVVRGIQKFFKHCYNTLRDERNARADKTDKVSINVQSKVESLHALAEDVPNKVQSDCHGFVVTPSTGVYQKFITPQDKKNVDPEELELRTISGMWEPAEFDKYVDICVFIATKDRPQDFPVEWLSDSLYKLGQEYNLKRLQATWSDYNGRPDNLLLPHTSTNLNRSLNQAIQVSNQASASTAALGSSSAAGDSSAQGLTFREFTSDASSRSRHTDPRQNDHSGSQSQESSHSQQKKPAGSRSPKPADNRRRYGRSQEHESNGGQHRRQASSEKNKLAVIPRYESSYSSGRSRPKNDSSHKDEQPNSGEHESSDSHGPRSARSQKDKQTGGSRHQ